jgi:hypothetical protein
MLIRSTQFPPKDIYKVTWVSPQGKTTNQIVHKLLDSRQPTIITNVRIHTGTNYVSGQYLVKGKYRARIQIRKQQYRKERKKIWNSYEMQCRS